ncbi:hypothetical protein ACFSUD_02360 [Sulfitobacter aestuarii]|uniref:Apolipoprotein D and lipocalin family protein n=1 Tax=Sulfitobacter aestuarii TaxID=2161676 RepID=A0ABW5TXQ0_9RHOB
MAVLVLLMLSACGVQKAAPLVELPYRNPTAVMGGTTRFDPARFAGEWHVVARFGQESLAPRSYVYDAARGVIRESGAEPRLYRVSGPGILSQFDPVSDERLVVMWVDEGFRTAALGTVSGQRGVILDRSPQAAPDRLAAAIEILDFNGWDTGRLQKVNR